MLDRTAELVAQNAEAERPGAESARPPPRQDGAVRRVTRSIWHFFVSQSFSSLTRRIVFLNLAGLVALVTGVLYLSQFRAGLIDARVQSLLTQSEIIAGAIAASATVETDSITIDPERLLELQAGESYGPADDSLSGIEFPINPERVAPLLRRLVSPTKTRARIYDRDGVLILDSRNLYGRGDVLRFDLPPPSADKPGLMERAFIALRRWFGRGDLPLYNELGPENGKGYQEVSQALNGAHASMEDAAPRADIFVTATGNKDIITIEHMRAMKDRAIVCNIGHFDNEIQISHLKNLKWTNIKPQVDEIEFPDKHRIILLSEGRLVNLGNAMGHPSFVMSASFTNQTLAQIELFANQGKYQKKVYVLPKTLDEKVARLHLAKIGVKLTELRPDQANYIGVPKDGPFKSDHYRY